MVVGDGGLLGEVAQGRAGSVGVLAAHLLCEHCGVGLDLPQRQRRARRLVGEDQDEEDEEPEPARISQVRAVRRDRSEPRAGSREPGPGIARAPVTRAWHSVRAVGRVSQSHDDARRPQPCRRRAAEPPHPRATCRQDHRCSAAQRPRRPRRWPRRRPSQRCRWAARPRWTGSAPRSAGRPSAVPPPGDDGSFVARALVRGHPLVAARVHGSPAWAVPANPRDPSTTPRNIRVTAAIFFIFSPVFGDST